MKKNLIEVFKGFVVGMGMIAPGLSGGVFAVTLGIYPRIMNGIASFFNQPVAVIKDLLWIGIGGLLGFSVTFLGLLQLIEWLPLPFTMLFIGFIVGALPNIFHKVRDDLSPLIRYGFFLLFFTLILILPFLPTQEQSLNQGNWLTLILLILVGFIVAGTLIIPGISGSLVLMAIGYYTYLLNLGRNLAESILTFNGTLFGMTVGPLLVLLVGFVIGLIVFSRSINYLLIKHQSVLYISVLGLLAASPVSILLEATQEYPNLFATLWLTIPLGIIALIGGFWIAQKMEALETKKQISSRR